MHLANQLGLLHRAQTDLADAFRQVSAAHRDEPDVEFLCQRLASWSDRHADELRPFVDRYGEDQDDEPDRLEHDLFQGTRTGAIGLLRDLQDLYVLASACDISWTLVGQAAQGARDEELLQVVKGCETETEEQLRWLRTRMKAAAPQALVVAK